MVYAALDGLTQGIEAFVSRQANFFSDLFAREAVVRFGQALAGINRGLPLQEVLADLAYGSTCGGVAMAAARLGAVHGLAHPVGVFYGQPHGKVCASLLPAFMRFNLPAAAGKYAVLTAALGIEAYGDELDKAAALVKFIITLNRKLGSPYPGGSWGKERRFSGTGGEEPAFRFAPVQPAAGGEGGPLQTLGRKLVTASTSGNKQESFTKK